MACPVEGIFCGIADTQVRKLPAHAGLPAGGVARPRTYRPSSADALSETLPLDLPRRSPVLSERGVSVTKAGRRRCFRSRRSVVRPVATRSSLPQRATLDARLVVDSAQMLTIPVPTTRPWLALEQADPPGWSWAGTPLVDDGVP